MPSSWDQFSFSAGRLQIPAANPQPLQLPVQRGGFPSSSPKPLSCLAFPSVLKRREASWEIANEPLPDANRVQGKLQCSDPQVLSLPTGGGVGTLQTPQPLAKTTFLLKGEQKPIGPGSLWMLAWRS